MKKLTNAEFLNKLSKINTAYVTKKITNLSKYKNIDTPITFMYKGFKYKMTPYNLLNNKKIVFRSCIEKEKYLQQYLKKDKILKVSGSYSYVKSAYGICKITNQNIKKGVGPNLKNAINKNNYFLNCINNVNKNYKKRDFKIIGKYKKSSVHILVENKYGKCLISPNHLIQGKKPSLESAINKDTYFKKMMIEIHGDIYEYKSINNFNFRKFVEFKCSKHGWQTRPWNLFYVHKTACLKCNKEKMIATGFTKEKYIKICNGRKSFLYLLKFKKDKEEFYKIGITVRSIKERFYGNNYKIEEVFIKKDFASKIFDMEKELHKQYKVFKYLPKIKFNGYTECYNIKLPIKEIIKKYE